jgi:hypothetical protein
MNGVGRAMAMRLSWVAIAWLCLTGVKVMAEVPDPWTPVTVQQVNGEIRVSVWGREYRFAKQPLPSQITTAGVELLAQPMRLLAFSEKGELAWTQSGCELWERTDEQATLLGWQVNDAVIANFVVRVEFDGLMRVDLTLAPLPQPKASLQRLWLEIPLRKERATLFHYWTGRWGSAENSGAIPTDGMRLPFKPIVWLGWEEGGLTWCAESDRNWQVAEGNRAIEVVPNGNAVVLRVHLLDTPPQKLPLSIHLRDASDACQTDAEGFPRVADLSRRILRDGEATSDARRERDNFGESGAVGRENACLPRTLDARSKLLADEPRSGTEGVDCCLPPARHQVAPLLRLRIVNISA